MLLLRPSHVKPNLFIPSSPTLDLFCAFSASSAARPLKRISHPTTLAIEIFPRTPTPLRPHHERDYIPPDSTTLHYSDSFRLTLSAFGETFHLHLRPNDQLVHPSARIVYYDTDADGQSVLSHTEPLLPSAIKAYWGEVVPAHASAERMRADAAHAGDARVGRPPMFEGAFSVRGVTHHVTSLDNYLRNRGALDPHPHLDLDLDTDLYTDSDRALVIWRDSDVMDPWEEHAMHTGAPVDYARDRRSLRSEPEAVRGTSWYDPFGLLALSKRDDIAGSGATTNFANTIGQTNGCPKEQQVLYMGVAADCEYVSHYGSRSNASHQILTVWNTATALYKNSFNISLGIVELRIQNSTCPTVADPTAPWNVNCSTPNVDLNARLSLFSQWRGQKGQDGAGLWHLMSNCPTGSEVGIAWLGTLCQINATSSGDISVSGTAVSTTGLTEWQIVSHEMGHNFGAIHDCTDGCNSTSSCCPLSTTSCSAGTSFLMCPVTASGEMKFSPCSTGNICSLMQRSAQGALDTTCLANPSPARQTIALQMCGNGILESGEECDPGLGVNSTCCDSSTCKFTNNAVCDPNNSPCCTAQCQFAPATQVCRPAVDPTCDVAGICTGNSSACPAHSFAPNGKSCGPNGLACASGQCTSNALQCKQLGTSLNLTAACPNRNDQTCQVSCQDPTNPSQCMVLNTLLIDGSPCGYAGTCQNGTCQSTSFLRTAKAWYVQNLQISIPVTIAAVLFTITIFWGIIGFCRSRKLRKLSVPFISSPEMQRIPSGPGTEPRRPVAARYPFATPSASVGYTRGMNPRVS
ncbi:Metallo-peptidase family M12-domain-containing protein [Lactifluus volemus]|nr:Metallo-peptidase family M12-domain-containing protein [Lactifluus volemus]